MLQLRMDKRAGDLRPPFFYGFAYYDLSRDCACFYPLLLHLVMRWRYWSAMRGGRGGS